MTPDAARPALAAEPIRMDALLAEDRAAWLALCRSDPRQGSPFLWPQFAEAVASVRDDVRLALLRAPQAHDPQRDSPCGFFAFHRRPGGLARPAGAPVSDWQGPVLRADAAVTPEALVSACGADALRMTGVRPDLPTFVGRTHRPARSWFIDLAGGGLDYLAALKRAQPKHLANTARCGRKAEREIGPVRFCFHDPDPDVLATIIAWKRARFRATGKHDIFTAAWIRALFERLARSDDPDFGLVVATVRFGDRLAAGEIYLRGGDRLHAWIAAYDRDLLSYAPGQILTERMLPEAPAHGVRRIDFGASNDAYKSRWCLGWEPIAQAVLHADTMSGLIRSGVMAGWRRAQPAFGRASELVSRVRGGSEHVIAAQGGWILGMIALIATLALRPRL